MWGPCGDPLPLPSPLPGSSGRAGGSSPSSPPSLARELRVYGCHNKVPRTGRLTTAEVCSLGVLKSRKPESRCRHGQRPLQGLGEPRPRPSPTFQWSPATLGLQLQRADLCPAPRRALCAPVSLRPNSPLPTRVLGELDRGPTLTRSDRISRSVTPPKTLSLNKVAFRSSTWTRTSNPGQWILTSGRGSKTRRGAVLSSLLTVPTGPPRRCGVHADNAALLPSEEQEGSQVPPAPRPGG